MLNFIVFLFGALIAFFIPGNNLLKPVLRLGLERIYLSFILGIVMWTMISVIFGYLQIRNAIYIYLITNLLIWIYLNKKAKFLNLVKCLREINFFDLVIVIVGVVLNLSAVWFMGVWRDSEFYLCCRGVPDAIFHLSLTHELINNFPPYEPGMSGVFVKNYHFLSNLATAEFSRAFNINFVNVQFQYFSLMLSLLLGTGAFVISKILNAPKSFARWLAVLLFASGDIIYVLLFLRGKGFNFDVTVIDDASKLLAGPPRAFSIILFFGGLALLTLFIKRKSIYLGLLMSLVMGSLIGFKVYTGIFALSGLAGLSIYYIFNKKFLYTVPSIVALIISIFYFFPINSGSGGLFFNGFWRFENFMLHKDLSISILEYLRLEQLQRNRLLFVFLLECLFVFVYFIVLFGTTNFALLQNKRSLTIFGKELNVFLITAIIVSLISGSFFYQKTGGANTVQFLISVFIISSLYASLGFMNITKIFSGRLKLFIIITILLFTTSRSLYEIYNNFVFIKTRKGYVLSKDTIESINFLKYQTPKDSIVAVEPWMAEDEPYLYMTFLSERKFFLSGGGVLRDHGQNTSEREKINNIIFSSNDYLEVYKLLLDNGLNYIYVPRGKHLYADTNNDQIQKVFSNNEATIYKVN